MYVQTALIHTAICVHKILSHIYIRAVLTNIYIQSMGIVFINSSIGKLSYILYKMNRLQIIVWQAVSSFCTDITQL